MSGIACARSACLSAMCDALSIMKRMSSLLAMVRGWAPLLDPPLLPVLPVPGCWAPLLDPLPPSVLRSVAGLPSEMIRVFHARSHTAPTIIALKSLRTFMTTQSDPNRPPTRFRSRNRLRSCRARSGRPAPASRQRPNAARTRRAWGLPGNASRKRFPSAVASVRSPSESRTSMLSTIASGSRTPCGNARA